MKKAFLFWWSLFVILWGISHVKAADAQPPTAEPEATYNDIKQTLGLVPAFLRLFPEEAIPGAWRDMKNIQLSEETSLSGKTKELIGLAVAAQVPCLYCVHFHAEAAKYNEATDREIREAAAVAALTRKWSTVMNGLNQDGPAFRAEIDKSVNHRRALAKKTPSQAPNIVTADDAFRDMERNLGAIPNYMRAYPVAGIVGAWKEFKSLMIERTSLGIKDKELVSLAVAAQIPCGNCVYSHTQNAKLFGATDEEIKDALAMAAMTRHWSTFLNGIQMDEGEFRKETRQIMQFIKGQKARALGKKPETTKGRAIGAVPPQEPMEDE